ncbi:MAG: hypothetical protein GY748_23255 [Planctomycetaceae bacterium]|nr:hypothetical protein [Planctomycetaceae bacterium]
MKITFIKDVSPIKLTGWSEYKAGTKADLRYGSYLIEADVAVAGWDETKVNEQSPPVVYIEMKDTTVNLDYSSMLTKDIRRTAQSADVWKRGMSRTEMIEALAN